MADRNLNFSPDVTNVVPKAPDDLEAGLAGIAAQVADNSEKSKVLLNSAAAHVQFKQLDAQFRQQYVDDPTNAEGLRNLAEARQNVVDGLSDNISTFYTRQFQEKTTELAGASDASNELWATHQQRINTVNNVNTSIKTYTDMANKDGAAYGASDASDASQAMNYLIARQQIEQTGNSIIGADKTAVLLKTFNSDYVKSFVSGVAESSPTKAADLLNDPNIVSHFTTAERGEMIDQIAKVKRQQEIQKDLTVTVNNSSLTDIVNDPQTTYAEKRATIDQLDMAGSISSTAASKARRVIRSSSDLDTQTDTPVMADIVSKIYGLNSISQTNSTDYLSGVRNIQESILDRQSTGQLTAADASKLNRQLTDLTSKRVADATQTVGLSFMEANDKFQALPPEYRSQATQQLFYAGQDGGFDNLPPNAPQAQRDARKQKYSTAADGIIDNIKAQQRSAAQRVIAATSQSDAAFLRSIKATSADVTETAQRYHTTEKEVLRQLRAAHAGKRTASSNDAADIPAKPVELEGESEDSGEDGEE